MFLFAMVVVATAFSEPFNHIFNAVMILVIAVYLLISTKDIIILRKEEK
jgi:hypothetical protein